MKKLKDILNESVLGELPSSKMFKYNKATGKYEAPGQHTTNEATQSEWEITYAANNVNGKKTSKGQKVKVKARNTEEAHRKAAKKAGFDAQEAGMLNTIGKIKKLDEELVTERLSGGAIKRMQGLVNSKDVAAIKNATNAIIQDLESDGFEVSEIKDFINLYIDRQFMGY